MQLGVTSSPVFTIKTMLKKSNYRKKQFSCIVSSDFIMFPATLLIPHDFYISPVLQNSDLSFAEIHF